MLYDYILIDSASLFYKLKKTLKISSEITKKMINYIEGEVKTHLKENGEIYILFDPISYNDLGESKNFYFSLNERKKILADYKTNRQYSPLYLSSIELFRKYYLYRGDKIKLVYSDEHEADDFAMPIIELIQNKYKLSSMGVSVAIVTTDYDFASYISGREGQYASGFVVDMINERFDNPFTAEQFEKIFEFKPTRATNTLYKALFGDKSDNITGAIFIKKAKFNTNIKVLCRDYLQMISKNKISLQDVIKQFKSASFMSVNKKENKDAFDLLYLSLSLVDLKVPVLEKLYTNIRIIRSSLEDKDIDYYTHSNPINNTINDIVHKSIFGIPFKSAFGRT